MTLALGEILTCILYIVQDVVPSHCPLKFWYVCNCKVDYEVVCCLIEMCTLGWFGYVIIINESYEEDFTIRRKPLMKWINSE